MKWTSQDFPADNPHWSHFHLKGSARYFILQHSSCNREADEASERTSQHTAKFAPDVTARAPQLRRPPQSNYPPDSVPPPDYGSRLETEQTKGGISPLAPPSPKARVQSLPPILRIPCPASLSSCSKGARGLSV